MQKNAAFFARNGIVPATRIWALFLPKGRHPYQTLVAADGTPRPLDEFACPLDSAFCEMAEGYVADLARTVASCFEPVSEVRVLGTPVPGAPPARYVPDVTRAEKELGLTVKTGLREAIKKTGDA